MADMTLKNLLENKRIEYPNIKAKQAAILLHEIRGMPDKVIQFLNSGQEIDTEVLELKRTLHKVCRKGHLKLVKELLKLNIDVNCRNIKGETALYVASKEGHFEIVKELLKNKANPNIYDNQLNTPLMRAIDRFNWKIVTELLKKGANPNLKNNLGKTALHLAAFYGSVHIVKPLLKFGANPNIKNRQGFTALHEAATNFRDVKIVEDLLKHGANINAQTNSGQTALHCYMTVFDRNIIRSSLGMQRKAKLLLKTVLNVPEIDFSIRCDGGSTALEMAVQHRLTHVARMIAIKACPKPKITDSIYQLKKLL